MPDPDRDSRDDTPTVTQLFLGFLTLGITGFGGVLPLARRMLVEHRGWLTADEFTELLGLCQFLPGGNIINLSVAVGTRFRGWRGAIASISGLILAPTAIVVALGVVYERYSSNPYLAHAFLGLAASAAGLLVSLAFKTLAPLLRQPIALGVAATTVAAIAVAGLPLVPVMIVEAAASILIDWALTRGAQPT